MADFDTHATQRQVAVARQPVVRLHHPGGSIDPGRQIPSRRIQALLRCVRMQVLARRSVGKDARTLRLEGLQAVDMVGMVMGDDHMRHRLRRDLADFGDQCLGQGRRAQCVDDDDPRIGDDEAGVGYEVAVGTRPERRLALHKPNPVGHLHRLHGGALLRAGTAWSQRERTGRQQPTAACLPPQARCARQASGSHAAWGLCALGHAVHALRPACRPRYCAPRPSHRRLRFRSRHPRRRRNQAPPASSSGPRHSGGRWPHEPPRYR